MSLRLFLMFMIATFAGPAFAQEDYLVTARGDTLVGNITFLQGDKLDQVQVRGQKKILLPALQVRTSVQNGVIFRPVKYQDKLRMMKVLLDGYISYYAFQPSMENKTYASYLMVRADGERMEVPRLNFKREMMEFLNDQSINDSINRDLLGRSDIEHIIRQYNKNIRQSTQDKIKARDLYNSPEIQRIDSVIASLRTLETPQNTEAIVELTEALQEIRLRKLDKKIIPKYLRTALEYNKKYLAAGSAELDQLNEILNMLMP